MLFFLLFLLVNSLITISLNSSAFECDDCFGKDKIEVRNDILEQVKGFVINVEEFLSLNKISFRCFLMDYPVNEYLLVSKNQSEYSACWPLMSPLALTNFIKDLSTLLHPFEIDNPLYVMIDDDLIQLRHDDIDLIKGRILKKKELCNKILEFVSCMDISVYPFYLICKNDPVAACKLIDKIESHCTKCNEILINELIQIRKTFFEPLSLQIILLTELQHVIIFTKNYKFFQSISYSFFIRLKSFIDSTIMDDFEKLINLFFFVDQEKINDFQEFCLKRLISNPYSQQKMINILNVFVRFDNLTTNIYRGKILALFPNTFLQSLFTNFLDECINMPVRMELQRKAFLSLTTDSFFEGKELNFLRELSKFLTELDSISIVAHAFVFLENYNFLENMDEKKAKRLKIF